MNVCTTEITEANLCASAHELELQGLNKTAPLGRDLQTSSCSFQRKNPFREERAESLKLSTEYHKQMF